MKIIGISGSFASGQDTLARYMQDKHDFVWFSTSDMVRKFSMVRHGSIERPDLSETATFLRKNRGGGVLVEMGLVEYQNSEPKAGLVLSGIRSMGEMNAILKAGGVMVYVDADPKIRFDRMVSRKRDNESSLSQDEFLAREQAEWHAGDNETDFNKRDIRDFVEKNNMILWNDKDLETFLRESEQKLELV